MKLDIYQCETCSKETKDPIADGWIEIQKFIKYKGRNEHGAAMDEIYLYSLGEATFHFCTWDCLKTYDITGVKKNNHRREG